MNTLKKIVALMRYIAIIFLMFEAPFVWVLRDGLGPSSVESIGFDALLRVMSMPLVYFPILIFGASLLPSIISDFAHSSMEMSSSEKMGGNGKFPMCLRRIMYVFCQGKRRKYRREE